jgi:hypothetical protein
MICSDRHVWIVTVPDRNVIDIEYFTATRRD